MRKVKNYVVHALLVVLGLVLVVACGTTRTTKVEVTPTEVTTPAEQSTLLPQVSSVSLALVAGYVDTGPHPGTYSYSLLNNSDPSVATAALDDSANTFSIDFLAEGTTTLEVEEKFNGVAIGTSKLQITIDANGAVKIALLTNFSGNASLSYSLGTVTHPTPQAVNPTLVGNELSLGFTGESGTTQIELIENNGTTPTGLVGTLTIGTVANPGLVVSKDGTGTGTVSSSPAGIACGSDCSENYAIDTEVTLTATANAGFVFKGWTGCDSEPSATTCVVTMSTIKAVTATFDLATAQLTVVKDGTGTGIVTSAPEGINCGEDCTDNYPLDTEVTLTALADAGSIFSGWSDCDTATGDTCVVTMSEAKTVTATFTSPMPKLMVVKEGTGTGLVTSAPEGINCGEDCSENYAVDTEVTLTAAATGDAGSSFTGWTDCDTATGDTCVVTMSEAKTVTATFDLPSTKQLTVVKEGTGTGTVTSAPEGIDCGSDCSESYALDTEVTLTAVPDSGTGFTSWSGCNSSQTTNICIVTMSDVKTVTATFDVVATRRQLTVVKEGQGTGTVSSTPAGISCGTDCSESYPVDSEVTLTATADSGSVFTGWIGCTAPSGSTCVVTMAANTSVTAAFDLAPTDYRLTTSKAGIGSGLVKSSQTGILCGSDCIEDYPATANTRVTLTAIPYAGSVFTGWSGSACDLMPAADTCVVVMAAVKSVTATFGLDASPPITLDHPTSVMGGSRFEVDWTGPDGSSDYITVVPATADDDAYASFRYTSSGSPSTIQAGTVAGAYEVRYISGGVVLARTPITVTPAIITLDHPAIVMAGSRFEVDWTGPDGSSDYITVVPATADDDVYASFRYTSSGSPSTIQAGTVAGAYEVRYYNEAEDVVLARSPITVTPAVITLDHPASVMAGSRFEVDWTGPDGSSDYITVVPATADDDVYASFRYTSSGSPSTIQAGTVAGAYEVRYYNEAEDVVLARSPITVTPAVITLDHPTSVMAGSSFDVNWTGPDGSSDYITVVPATADDDVYASFRYTSSGSPSTIQAGTVAGAYEVRYYNEAEDVVLARSPITVIGGP